MELELRIASYDPPPNEYFRAINQKPLDAKGMKMINGFFIDPNIIKTRNSIEDKNGRDIPLPNSYTLNIFRAFLDYSISINKYRNYYHSIESFINVHEKDHGRGVEPVGKISFIDYALKELLK